MAGVVDDLRDANGLWLLEARIDGERVRTLSGQLWKNLQVRTKIGGSEQSRRHNYRDSRNLFTDFQTFASWHTKQVGCGLGYQLDKDLLVKGNADYSPDTCVLLPNNINTLLTNRSSDRGDFPVGVRLDKRSGKFYASCSDGFGKIKHIGTYLSPEYAFAAYKEYKEQLIQSIALKHKHVIDTRAYDALMAYEITIND